jgi:hypothetical protein
MKTLFLYLKNLGSLGTILTIATQAYPIVKMLARATPTRKDDEIISAIEAFGLDIAFNPALTFKERGSILKQIAVSLVTGKLAEPPAESKVSDAVQIAYQRLKAEAV